MIVCICNNINSDTIKDHVRKHGVISVEDLQTTLTVCDNCESCRCCIEEIIIEENFILDLEEPKLKIA